MIYPLFFEHLDAEISSRHGASLSMMTQYLMRWYQETSRWVDAVVKPRRAESEENQVLLQSWTAKWRAPLVAAITPLAARVMAEPDAALAAVIGGFDARAKKLGVG